MTKKEEMAVLDRTIKELGPDSYLGPLMSYFRGQIERSITSDFFPEVDMKKVAEDCQALRDQSNRECAAMLTAAQKQADAIRKGASDFDARVRAHVARIGRQLCREAGE